MCMTDQALVDPGDARWLQDVKTARPDRKYFALTLGANRRGEPVWGAQTHWVGWSERNPGWEIRRASFVSADWTMWFWKQTNQRGLVVHDDCALAVFLRVGGHALVVKEIAEAYLPNVIGPCECMHDGAVEAGGRGFLAAGHLDDDAIVRRAPTRKLRMQVLKRDKYRCVICGRRPSDHIDVELHVHHVIPWRMCGPTAEENLVTLCGTCHKGLVPDYAPVLRELAGLPGPASPPRGYITEFDEEVARYRQWIAQRVSECEIGPERNY
ncbi:HNH endonuclease [Mycobacteroides salmoniphilum]|uniref:HNH endonuclease n=2 Tax=Mycobacteroides salmoniphilum TaxID=404941 RepID=A0A4R8SIP6_9MYCO|nr:HNH endonuclease [Mycobacteroides salmoniphilum]TEA05895.1 HNH endonuclease [Mycobacteroides salmoniphilum]